MNLRRQPLILPNRLLITALKLPRKYLRANLEQRPDCLWSTRQSSDVMLTFVIPRIHKNMHSPRSSNEDVLVDLRSLTVVVDGCKLGLYPPLQCSKGRCAVTLGLTAFPGAGNAYRRILYSCTPSPCRHSTRWPLRGRQREGRVRWSWRWTECQQSLDRKRR